MLQLEPNNKKIQEELNRLRRDHLETVSEQEGQSKKGRRIEIEESEGDEDDDSEEEREPVVQTEVKGHPDSPGITSSAEHVGASINGSYGHVPSSMSEGTPQQDEAPPLSNRETVTTTQSPPPQRATPPEDAAEQDVSQPSSVTEPSVQPQEAPPTEVLVAPPPAPPPALPPAAQKLKEEGNDLFRRGQYGEAVERYSKSIKILQKGWQIYLY